MTPDTFVLLLLLAFEPHFVGALEPSTPTEVFGQGVRETQWRTPEQERVGFHVPPGFEVQLFASEPMIAKPLNMAWDHRGRLWVTSTIEYPYPVEQGANSRDSIKILEDVDGDGTADKCTTFADGLNIPMGLLPVADGVICFSIPNLWLLRDTNGDDHVDEKIQLLGPFDTSRDTHGMINSLHQGGDGWIYACHGFNNQSRVAASDGSSVQLNSGNTFRFKADGSRIEHYTHGQVNPFGMTRDDWGNCYSADCHSKPLTALLSGACYPSFGRAHDGLGFAPDMMNHLHGSTAICGLLFYQAEHFPQNYRKLFYSGNVMTSRVNCNALQWQGATAKAVQMPDFMTSDDPWFRPVDIQLGSDGAMYIADFYNKIIGHYEVPLEHPERDRDSGRIWRIVYRGDAAFTPLVSRAVELSSMWEDLASSNVSRRRLAIELALQQSDAAFAQTIERLQDSTQSETLRMSCLEIVFRLAKLNSKSLELPADTPHQRLLAKLLTLATQLPPGSRSEFLLPVRASLPYANPQVNRSAIALLGAAGSWQDIEPLTRFASEAQDPALAHVARIAIRDLLADERNLAAATEGWYQRSQADASENAPRTAVAIDSPAGRIVAGVLPALNTELAAERLLDFVSQHVSAEAKLLDAAIVSATRLASEILVQRLLAVITRASDDNLLVRVDLFDKVCESYLLKHRQLSPPLYVYGKVLRGLLAENLSSLPSADAASVDWTDAAGSDWSTQIRKTGDGSEIVLRSSFTRGESYTGKLCSESFTCPASLQFFLAGHNGRPPAADARINRVLLEDIASGAELVAAFPPRSDVAQRVDWDLQNSVGRQVRLVVSDGDAGDAYAWIALGEFSHTPLNPMKNGELFESYLRIVSRGFELESPQSQTHWRLSPQDRLKLIAAELVSSGKTMHAALVNQALELQRAELVPTSWLDGAPTPDQTFELGKSLASTCSSSQQKQLVGTLLKSADGCQLLTGLLDSGHVALRSLRSASGLLPNALPVETANVLREKIQSASELADTVDTSQARLASSDWSKANLATGQQIFVQHCAVCHQLSGQGGLIGPQLDGAVVRGSLRLCEDILEPNLNVDKAFRTTSLLLDDDTVLTGLVREENGGSLIITGQDGKSQQLSADRIERRRENSHSLMPSNFSEVLDDTQLVSLLKYLSSIPSRQSSQ